MSHARLDQLMLQLVNGERKPDLTAALEYARLQRMADFELSSIVSREERLKQKEADSTASCATTGLFAVAQEEKVTNAKNEENKKDAVANPQIANSVKNPA